MSKSVALALTVSLAVSILGGAVAPAFADKIVGCSVFPVTALQMNVGTSAVLQVTVSYNLFANSSWPMTVTVSPISAGFSANSSTFSDTDFGSHTFHVKITNNNPTITSGSGTVQVTWNTGSTSLCGSVQFLGTGQPLPCTLNNCFTSSGAVESTQGGLPVVSITFTSGEYLSDTEAAYLTVTNGAGQIVLIQQLVVSFTAQGTRTFSFTLLGLQAGSYSASCFLTNSQGVAVSSVYTVAFSA